MVLKWFYLLWQNLKWQKIQFSNVKKNQLDTEMFSPFVRETLNGKSFSISFHIYKWIFFAISSFAQIEEMVFVSQPSLFTFFNVINEVNLSRDGFLC